MDLDRQRAWFEEAQADADALREARDALVDEATGQPSADNQAEHQRLQGELNAMNQEVERLQGELDGFEAMLQAKRDEQAANEQARREAAAREEEERALEAEARAAQDRERDRERALEDQRNAKKNINEWEMEIEDLSSKMMKATSSKDYQFYESEIRRLNEQIGWEQQFIEDLENYFRQLDEDDKRHQEYLDQVEQDRIRGELEKNQGRIDMLESDKEYLEERKQAANEIKQNYERYNPDSEDERPDDWTEALAV